MASKFKHIFYIKKKKKKKKMLIWICRAVEVIKNVEPDK